MQAFFRKTTHHIIRAYALLFSFLSHFTTKRSTVKSSYSTHVPLIKKQIQILLKDGLTEMIRYIKLFHAYIHFFLHHWTWYHMYGVVCNHVPNSISLNFEIVLLKINFFNVFGSLWCADVKNKFQKNIILMHFQAKSTLKRNCYHTLKHPLLLSALPAYYPLWFTS